MFFGSTTYRACVTWAFFLFLLSMIPANTVRASSSDVFSKAENAILSGQYQKALDAFQGELSSSTQHREKARALFFIGFLHETWLGQPEKALDAYRDLRQRFPQTPESADALFHKGVLLYRLDRLDESKKAFEKYIEDFPKGDRQASAKAWLDLCFNNLTPPPEPENPERSAPIISPTIRVLLAKNEDQLVFKSESGLTVKDTRSGQVLMETSGPLVVSLKNGKRYLNTQAVSFKECEISSPANIIRMEGHAFRGTLRIIVRSKGLLAVNHLPVEDYLYGVVPKEMSWLWDPEALKAQAIASRTYALYIRESNKEKKQDYDLVATTISQVYGGLDAEKEQTQNAVNETRGMVITYRGKLAASYFHANSGGHTESATRVWGINLPYLKGVSDPFNSLLPDAIWRCRISEKEARQFLNPLTPGLKSMTDITEGKKSPSGRTQSVVVCSGSKCVTVNGNSFRLALGPKNIKSTWFDISKDGKFFVFKGVGYGHGVGMSQWGAQCMALAGYSYEAIIKHYYSGVKIGTVSYL